MPDSTELTPPTEPATSRADSGSAALGQFVRRTRRANRRYAAVLIAVALLCFIAVRLAYGHGELVHVSARSAPTPTPLPTTATGSALAVAWSAQDRPAAGDPYSDGVVVSYTAHTVNGRDARTGAVRWHYTRSDETLCGVAQQDRTTIAVFNRHGNCDQVTGFVSATGEPKWYRTLTDNGQLTLASAPNIVLMVGAASVHVIDNAGGLDRWTWAPSGGCQVDRALAGSLGTLISYHCGTQSFLILKDLIGGAEKWTVREDRAMVPFTAHSFLGAVDPATGVLVSYSTDKGAPGRQISLGSASEIGPAVTSLPRAQATVEGVDQTVGVREAIFAGRLYCFAKSVTLAWTADATGPVSLLTPDLLGAADGSSTVAVHALTDGALRQSVHLSPAPQSLFQPFQVGAGLLIASNQTELYA